MERSTWELTTGWSLKQRDDQSEEPWLPVAQVPSQVHIDLLANKIIPDPFVDANELKVQWIGEKDWIYRIRFNATPSEGMTTALVFQGLDTFATVTLNGSKILESDNMHIAHRVQISHLLRPDQENELQILFESALVRGRELIHQHPEHVFHVRQTEASRVPVRKAQYNWGWDWGPILMTTGPWRPVLLEQYVARIEDVWAQYHLSEDYMACSGHLFARVEGSKSGDKVVLTLLHQDKTTFQRECRVVEDGLVKIAFQLDQPLLWYPHGYGPQSRYQLIAQLFRQDQKLDARSKDIGFRHVELVQEQDDFGKSFYFRINGIDTFAGGSCWIPGDSYLSQISNDRYVEWVKLAVESNQIMIRVWGGGIYEDDAFLDACDSLGVLIWHDFAFACASYPVYPSFLKSIEEEARQNIRRLRSHPSVVIWAGNNEDYQVQERYKLEYRPEDTDPSSWLKSTFPARYIYEYLLPKLVQEEDPSCIYHPGSPWGDGRISSDPSVGDIHQWDIWHGQMHRYQDSAQLAGRFISEFGMEAYPHVESIRRVITDPAQQYPGSAMMDFRNKAIDHERRLLTYVAENFRIPQGLCAFTHITQILQAETMRYAYKSWRRMWGDAGARKCGGVLVWQLNDCWPTMSWAIVDYYLVKKPAFYAISRALRPLDVGIARKCPEWTSGHADTTVTNTDEFDLWVSSSRQDPVEVDVAVKFLSIRSGQPIVEDITTQISAKPNGTTEIFQNKHIAPFNQPDDQRPEQHEPFIIYATISIGSQVVATDTAWPQPLKYLDLSNRKVKVEVSPSRDQVAVSADLPVKGFVLAEREGMKLSDNGFDIMPGENHVIQLSGTVGTVEDLEWTYVGARVGEGNCKPRL
ncbi:glycoside hydrolase superfamily [Fusarium solani]|uniref:Beta-mannosidase B n=1 Tax=Fusarium solani TaxID=169388 RepID=A0A9P9FZU8_FUSSL|nr:glycoside hydrolase superfamily [Fusarium solani]KAH7230695.1 glycoside hydrolase superfamily [Fusarium solani]